MCFLKMFNLTNKNVQCTSKICNLIQKEKYYGDENVIVEALIVHLLQLSCTSLSLNLHRDKITHTRKHINNLINSNENNDF